MVDTVGPANSAPLPTTLTYNARQARQLNGVAFAGATAARPLGARTGVRPGTPASTVTATSTTWTCQAFAGLADVMTANEAGGYEFSCDGVATGAMNAADASNPRIDIIYVTITDPENGTTTPTVVRGYLAGTAAATPVEPSPPSQSFTVAAITVPKVGGGSPSVTWKAPYTAAAGAPVPFNTLAQLNAWTPATPYQIANVFADPSAANNGIYVYNGSAWTPQPFAESSGKNVAVGASGTTTINFPTGRFSVAPAVMITVLDATSGTVSVPWYGAVPTATGFGIRLFSLGGAQIAGHIDWTATQMTPTTAAG